MRDFDSKVLEVLYENINDTDLQYTIPKTSDLTVDISNVLFHHGSSVKLDKLRIKGSKKTNLYGPAIYLAAASYTANHGYGTYKHHVTLHPSDEILNGSYTARKQELYYIFEDATGKFAEWLESHLNRYTYPEGITLKFLLREAVYSAKLDLLNCGWDGIVDYPMEVAIFNENIIKSVDLIE